ncbi:hypothetical protein Tco_1124938 [Tanacetum coccineum]|uniref:Transmembrane protein n=1 Tax=Tanacetum coccineum TaxID=301880 RepID=A0ABQ5JAK5_9ASTR
MNTAALSVAPITLSFRKAPIDKVPVLQVQHQVPNQFETPMSVRGRPASPQFWAVSSKVTLSSALIATISLLIIVVVVAVVVICRSASTILGQMANLFAVIAPSVGLACVLPLILLLLVLIVLGKIIILSFPFSPDVQH